MIEKVPDIISTKDLSYISDMLNWNYILIKKFNSYLEIIEAEDINKITKKALACVKKNYDELLKMLEGGTDK